MAIDLKLLRLIATLVLSVAIGACSGSGNTSNNRGNNKGHGPQDQKHTKTLAAFELPGSSTSATRTEYIDIAVDGNKLYAVAVITKSNSIQIVDNHMKVFDRQSGQLLQTISVPKEVQTSQYNHCGIKKVYFDGNSIILHDWGCIFSLDKSTLTLESAMRLNWDNLNNGSNILIKSDIIFKPTSGGGAQYCYKEDNFARKAFICSDIGSLIYRVAEYTGSPLVLHNFGEGENRISRITQFDDSFNKVGTLYNQLGNDQTIYDFAVSGDFLIALSYNKTAKKMQLQTFRFKNSGSTLSLEPIKTTVTDFEWYYYSRIIAVNGVVTLLGAMDTSGKETIHIHNWDLMDLTSTN